MSSRLRRNSTKVRRNSVKASQRLRSFKCDNCYKSFAKKETLVRHIMHLCKVRHIDVEATPIAETPVEQNHKLSRYKPTFENLEAHCIHDIDHVPVPEHENTATSPTASSTNTSITTSCVSNCTTADVIQESSSLENHENASAYVQQQPNNKPSEASQPEVVDSNSTNGHHAFVDVATDKEAGTTRGHSQESVQAKEEDLIVKTFQCLKCHKCFTQKSLLDQHKTSCTIRCPQCKVSLPSRLFWKRHVASCQTKTVDSEEGTFYICLKCNERFPERDLLRHHLESCNPQSSAMCEKCFTTFKSKRALNLHSKVCGKSQKRYTLVDSYLTCHCGQEFQSTSLAMEHFLIDHTDHTQTDTDPRLVEAYKCEACPELISQKQYYSHRFRHCNHDEFECWTCNSSFSSVFEMNTHKCNNAIQRRKTDVMKQSEGNLSEKPYVCKICNSSMASLHVFSYHFSKFHTTLEKVLVKYKCKLCRNGYNSKSDSNYRDHVMRWHVGGLQVRCDLCAATTTTVKLMRKHIDKEHNQQQADVFCPFCNNNFCKDQHLKHLMLCRGVRKEVRKAFLSRHPNSSFNYLICKICKCKEQWAGVLISHSIRHYFHRSKEQQKDELSTVQGKCLHCLNIAGMTEVEFLCHYFREHCEKQPNEEAQTAKKPKTAREKTKVKNFQCEICSVQYSSRSQLQDHILSHTGVRSFQCKLCDKSYATKASLCMHKKAVHSQMRFTCEECGKTFKLKHHLAQHLVKHKGAECHKCHICSKEFKRPHTLRAHVLTHSEKQFRCEVCGKEFLYGWEQRKHMRETHPETVDMDSTKA